MDRYYLIETVAGLFGQFGVQRSWGRRDSVGRRRTDWYDVEDHARTAAAKLANKKQKRGYGVLKSVS
ncbi:WGR domain-containing protein [Jannaschia rubra]|uniref:WGR domain-containing protein n=1 Tax=Jannaschia rubra TaxID=282197 RepID=UPI003CD0E16F